MIICDNCRGIASQEELAKRKKALQGQGEWPHKHPAGGQDTTYERRKIAARVIFEQIRGEGRKEFYLCMTCAEALSRQLGGEIRLDPFENKWLDLEDPYA